MIIRSGGHKQIAFNSNLAYNYIAEIFDLMKFYEMKLIDFLFVINFELIYERPWAFWLIQMPIVAIFTYYGIWFYKNIKIENINKRWFRMMFWGSEWKSILKSGQFLKEIETFEKA